MKFGLTVRSAAAVIGLAAVVLSSGCSTMSKDECTDCDEITGVAGEFHGWSHYGMDVTVETEPICPGKLLNTETTGRVIVAGPIVDVCQMKGCWMMMGEGDHLVRVTFKDYSFFVPMNGSEHRAVVVGNAYWAERDVETLKHFAEDQGKSQEEIDAITEPMKVIEIEAESVFIEGEDLDEPHKQ